MPISFEERGVSRSVEPAGSSKPLRVVIYDPSGRGGICQYSYNLAQHLAETGARVTVLAPDPYELVHLPRRFKLKRIFKRSWVTAFLERLRPRLAEGEPGREPAQRGASGGRRRSLGGRVYEGLRALRVRWILGRVAVGLLLRRPDVFHVQWLVAHDEEWRLLKALKRAGIPLVHTAHDVLPHGPHSAEDRAFFGRLYGLVDRVIVHTERNRQELLESFGIASGTTSVIPHGSFAAFTGAEVTREAARQELGIPDDKRVILFFGLIKRYKGLEYLIEAFREVRSRVDGATLVIAGRVATEDPESGPYYTRLLGELEGSAGVRIFPEFVPFSRLPVFFAAADVVALPYVKTYQSGVLLWAYGAGRPVVTTDTGGLGESVDEGESGYVVPTRDSGALAQALVRVLEPPQHASTMGVYARELAETRYSWARIASRTLEMYRAISSPGPQARAALAPTRVPADGPRKGDGLCPP